MTAGRAVLLVVALYAAFWLGYYAGARRLPRTFDNCNVERIGALEGR